MPQLPEHLSRLPHGMVPAESSAAPVTPRDAVTVMLVRNGARGLEVFLLRRVAGMAFAGGMTVFPGGGVDQRDSDISVAWAGPDPAWWAARFNCTEGLARAMVCAAVRETFEEAGVLLAGPDATTIVSDTREYARSREALESREVSLAQFLADQGLVLRADLLRPWSNWLTPAGEPRRYDTRFFLAALPDGQVADGATSEADNAGWRAPATALAECEQGTHQLLPPTWVSLCELGEYSDVGSALGASRQILKITPELTWDGGEPRVVLPDGVL